MGPCVADSLTLYILVVGFVSVSLGWVAAPGMSGSAARKKKLVRGRRLSEEETSDEEDKGDKEVDEGGTRDNATTGSKPGKHMATSQANNPWHRAAVRAVELQAGYYQSDQQANREKENRFL